MDTEKITTLFKPSVPASSHTRMAFGPHSHLESDRHDADRYPAVPSDVTATIRRPTESHWEWIIDRATD